MNYRIVKKSRSNLINYPFTQSITHNKASNILLNFSKHLINFFASIISSMFTPTKYTYNELTDTKYNNINCYYENITDLKLKASQRTFL